jgi:hypothetical protein
VPCASLLDPVCVGKSLLGQAAGSVTGGVMGAIADSIQSGIAWMVSHTVDWWVQVPSPDLASEPAVGSLQRWLLPVTVAVAVLAMLAAAGKMALTRKANPLVDVASGLLVIAAVSAVGVLLPSMLVKAGDAWSSWVLAASTGGDFGARLTSLLTLAGATPGVVIVLGIVAIIMTAIQAVLMLFRGAALVILAGALPLAAAGTLAPATRAWFRRVTGWMLALIFYKPAAAAVYAAAFTLVGRGHDPRTVFMGFAMVLLSLLALPALMRFFTWTTGSVEGPAGGGFLGTMVSGAIAVGAMRASMGGPSGASAVDQARLLSAQLGAQGTGSAAGGRAQGATNQPGGTVSGPGTTPPGAGSRPGSGPGGAVTTAAPAGTAAETTLAPPETSGARIPPAGSPAASAPSSPTGTGARGTATGSAGTTAAAGTVAGAAGVAAVLAKGAADAAQRTASAAMPGEPTHPDGSGE